MTGKGFYKTRSQEYVDTELDVKFLQLLPEAAQLLDLGLGEPVATRPGRAVLLAALGAPEGGGRRAEAGGWSY